MDPKTALIVFIVVWIIGFEFINDKLNSISPLLLRYDSREDVIKEGLTDKAILYFTKNDKMTDETLYRSSINYNDDLVRGLASDLGEKNMLEIASIIKEIRSTRQDLEL